MHIDVIVSAHRNAQALHYTLLGYRQQRLLPVQLWVTEDGEDPAVAAVVRAHQALAPFAITHLTQPHRGFGKWALVNRAIAASRAPWLVFTDADCVPRGDLLAQYARLARPGRFVSGGSHLDIPEAWWQHRLTDRVVQMQRLFEAPWLQQHGVDLPALRLLPAGAPARWLDRLTPRSAFAGNNAGAWRDDLLRVGGFDETLGYGGGDRNLGIRLENLGVHGIRARHSLVCVHLGHQRPWRDQAAVTRNKAFNRQLQRMGRETLPRASSLLPDPGLLTHPAAGRRFGWRGIVSRAGGSVMWKRVSMLWALVRGDAAMVWRALRHPGAPGWLKPAVALLLLYVLSPVDLIPDVVPVAGLLDDMTLVPLALHFLLKRLPAQVLADIAARPGPARS